MKGRGIAEGFQGRHVRGGTEVLQQINNLAEKLTYDSGKNLTEGLVAFMGGAGSGAHFTTCPRGCRAVQAQIESKAKRTAADAFAGQMQGALQTAAESKLRERSLKSSAL